MDLGQLQLAFEPQGDIFLASLLPGYFLLLAFINLAG